jgi:hypothetical protein
MDVPDQRWITRVRLHFDSGPDVNVTLGPTSRSPTGQAVTFPSRTFRWVELIIEGTNLTLKPGSRPNGVGFSEVRIGVARPGAGRSPFVDEVLRLPTDLLDSVGAANITHRLTILLTRLQTNPAEPFTGNPEPSIARTFTLPTTRTFALGGVAQISALAPDYMLDPLLGRPNPRGTLIANSSGRLPGDLAARSSSALDGNPATAWVSGRGPQVGNWIRVDLPHPVALDHLHMQIIADGRHSVPTRLGVSVDGGPYRSIALPPIADATTPDAVTPVAVSLPGVTAEHEVVITIEAVRNVTTLDNLSGTDVIEPIGIAELGLPGIQEAAPAASVPSYCRSDLITVDGRPISVRLVGTTAAAAARQDLTLQSCGAPLTLAAGPHVVRTTPGHLTGIDVNRLVLSSAPGGGADPTLGRADSAPVGPTPAVTVLSQSRTSMKVRVGPSDAASWLVLGESLNQGWTARVDGPGGRSLGAPRLIDGFANGWQVPASSQPFVVSLSWTPQHGVDVALAASAVAVLVCLVLAFGVRRRRWSPVAVAPDGRPVGVWPWEARARLSGRRSVGITLGAGLASAVLISPPAGLFVAVVVGASCCWRRGRVLLAGGAVALMAAAAVAELGSQLVHHFPLVLEWPQHFEGAGHLAWLGVALLAAEAVTDRLGAA